MEKNTSMDERTMIREQERLAKEAKRRKTKKIKIAFGAVAAAAVIGGIWYAGWGRKLATQSIATTVKIEKSVGQNVVYAKITEINGNEITYAVAEAIEEASTGTENTAVFDDAVSSEGMTAPGEQKPSGISEDRGQGGMPFGDGEMPDMSQMPGGGRGQGGMPFGDGEMPDRTQTGGRGNAAGAVGSMDQFTYDGTTYRVGEESVTAYIPVGTNVTTKLGTVTTFSRLAANDYVALIMDKDGDTEVIAAVYIVG
ncbi:MAG: hypothetical protein J6A45_02145 [Lachnospiraceae bacterium]|nr:hypothetical protein [Lachnospiraceae bacterium]